MHSEIDQLKEENQKLRSGLVEAVKTLEYVHEASGVFRFKGEARGVIQRALATLKPLISDKEVVK